MILVPAWQLEYNDEYWNALLTQGEWGQSAMLVGDALPLLVEEGVCSQTMDQKWERLSRLFADGTILCLDVMSYNKGGLLVAWEEMQGFVPISQLLEAPVMGDDCARMDCLAEYVGQQMTLKIIELDRAQNRIIFSERAAGWGECCPDTLLQRLQPSDICEGHVSNLCDFGVFVDLGGIDGLIHVSELSWQRVTHPCVLLQLGQRIKVYVISVDHQRRRIALSLKRLTLNPWDSVARRYQPGQVVFAHVTNVVDFGVFACLEEGIEGLIHISELGEAQEGQAPLDVLKRGTALAVRILSVDPDNQRIALSLRGIGEHDT